MSDKDDAKTKVVYDLDAIAKVAKPSETTLSIVRRAADDAQKHHQTALQVLTSPQMLEAIGSMQLASKQIFAAQQQASQALTRLTKTYDTSRLFANVIATDISKLVIIKQETLDQLIMAMPKIEPLSKQLLNAIEPLYDLRLATNTIFTDLAKQMTVFRNFTFDISTLFGSLHISRTTEFTFKQAVTTLERKDNQLGLHTTAVQTHTNELVVQERHAKVELILATNKAQNSTLLRLENEVTDIKALVGQLVQHGQQLFTVKDIGYDASSYFLTIGGKRIKITARRERQLCELLLTTLEAMQKKWDLEELLYAIDEGYNTPMSQYRHWLDRFYYAANRLNNALKPILKIDKLVIVDFANEQIYINPAFYHK